MLLSPNTFDELYVKALIYPRLYGHFTGVLRSVSYIYRLYISLKYEQKEHLATFRKALCYLSGIAEDILR